MNKIDWEFIGSLEGKAVSVGYQPTSNSGVTICTGFDLKEKNESFLNSIGLPEEIIIKLSPFLGLTGDIAKVKAPELVLKPREVEIIDVCSKKYYAHNIMKQFDSVTQTLLFENLNKGQQTVITSVGFQYGSFKRTPTFWRHATNGHWKNVVSELRDFGDAFNTRRNLEADYLERYL